MKAYVYFDSVKYSRAFVAYAEARLSERLGHLAQAYSRPRIVVSARGHEKTVRVCMQDRHRAYQFLATSDSAYLALDEAVENLRDQLNRRWRRTRRWNNRLLARPVKGLQYPNSGMSGTSDL